jgi:hypothetical protein
MKNRKKRKYLVGDTGAALGLPMRLTVSVVIGTIALIAILSFILNPCLFPKGMIVSVTPYVTVLPGSEPENVSFAVHVNDTDGHPLSGASVIIKGLGGAGAGFSDKNGQVQIQMQVQLESGLHEGYLDILVQAACYKPFDHRDIIKVVKSTE